MENWGFCGKQKNCFPTLPSSSQALQLVRRHLKGRSEVSFDTLCLPKRVALLSAKSQKGQKSRLVTNHQQTDQGKPLCELVQSHTNIKNHSPIQLPNQQRFTSGSPSWFLLGCHWRSGSSRAYICSPARTWSQEVATKLLTGFWIWFEKGIVTKKCLGRL